VRIYHARDDGAALHVDHARPRTSQRERAPIGPNESHAPTADRHRFAEWATLVDRVDAGVGDDKVGGRWLRRERCWNGDEKRSEQRGLM
jgi:hypothetical protein